MDKIIQLGIEARKNDTVISRIETMCYQGNISEGKALDLIIQQLERYNKTWKKIINEGKITKKQFMLDKQLEALNIN